jgi:hypothetical protein
MPVETPSLFASVIQDHLELKERNSMLERVMPLERYRLEDPFQNHPLFKTEEQARLEETMDGDVSLPTEDAAFVFADDEGLELASADDGLWSRSRDFDWGD